MAGVALIIFGQWLWFEFPYSAGRGATFALAGMVLVASTAQVARRTDETRRDSAHGVRSTPVRLSAWKLPYVLLGTALGIYVAWYADQERITVWNLYLFWFGSIWFVIYGLVPHGIAVAWRERAVGGLRREWRTVALISIVFSLGFVLRVYDLAGKPYIMAGDEAAFAIQAVDIRQELEWIVNPFKYGAWHHPYIYHTLVGLAIKYLGQTTIAARLPSVLLGTMTIPGVYLMGRRLLGHRTGMAAAVFLAVYPLHIHFSRLGINQVGDPLFSAWAFAFLARALREADMMEGALAGTALGFSQYFYSASRLVPLLALVYVGGFVLWQWRVLSHYIVVILIIGYVGCIVILPGAYAIYRDAERPISPRLDHVSVWATGDVQAAADEDRLPAYWRQQFERSLLAYVQGYDESGFYGRYNPALGWFAGVPFMLGIAAALRWGRDAGVLLLLVWIAATAILGSALLVDPPHFPRYVSAVPAIALMVGRGLVVLSGLFASLIARIKVGDNLHAHALHPNVHRVVLLLVVVLIASADIVTYFADYLPRKLVFGESTVQLNETADILNTFEGRYTVWYFSSSDLDLSGTSLIRYLTPENVGTEFRLVQGEWPPDARFYGPQAFLITPTRYDEIVPLLVSQLPGGELQQYLNERTGQPLLFVYFIDL